MPDMIAIETSATSGSITGVPSASFASSGMTAPICVMPHAMTKPITAPMKVMKKVSAKNCAMMVLRFAPIARLMPISRVRSLTTTYMMFDTPRPPTQRVIVPIRTRKILKASKKRRKSLKNSAVSHTLRASSSDGSKTYFLPSTS
jgi:hypothetical protein